MSFSRSFFVMAAVAAGLLVGCESSGSQVPTSPYSSSHMGGGSPYVQGTPGGMPQQAMPQHSIPREMRSKQGQTGRYSSSPSTSSQSQSPSSQDSQSYSLPQSSSSSSLPQSSGSSSGSGTSPYSSGSYNSLGSGTR